MSNVTAETSEARRCLQVIRWSQRQLGEAVPNTNHARIRRMLAGVTPMDPGILAWLRQAARWHTANPVPSMTRNAPDDPF